MQGSMQRWKMFEWLNTDVERHFVQSNVHFTITLLPSILGGKSIYFHLKNPVFWLFGLTIPVSHSLGIFTLPNMHFSWHVDTARCKLPAWASTPIYPSRPYTYWPFIFIQLQLDTGGWGGGVVLSLQHNAVISTWAVLTGETVKSGSCWPSWERRWCSRIMH